jgi:single-stranded DNA-binding protein
VSFAGNLTDDPEVRYTLGERRSIVESTDSVPDWGPNAHADP